MDFDKVRPVDGSVRTGFEELCVALTPAICGAPLAEQRRVDGSGGDGGVELVGTTQDGRTVGIQAKYFTKRLGPSQWQQIKSSVATAMRNHPNLNQYFVCVGLDRTPGEISKWDALQALWLSAFPHLSVQWVGRSELVSLLTQERWAYLGSYWLDRPDFSIDRVRAQSEAAIKQLHHRFTPNFHHRTAAERALGHMLAIPSAKHRYRQLCIKLASSTHALLDLLATAEWSVLEAALAEQRSTASAACSTILDTIEDGDLSNQSSAFNAALVDALAALRALSTAAENLRSQVRTTNSKAEDAENTRTLLLRISDLRREINTISVSRAHYTKANNDSCWLVSGEAGTGKSHLLATIVRSLNSVSGAALMFLGEQFQDTRPISLQICDQFGWNHGFSRLLHCLQAHAELVARPSLLVIDAINETPRRSLWLNQLVSLDSALKPYPDVHLVISCRDDWLESCVPDSIVVDASRIKHKGYEMDFEEVVMAYFQGYEVTSDSFPVLIPEYSNPLFLKTVCEAYQGRKLPAAPLSFVRVLEVWEHRVAEEISKAIDCPPVTTKKVIAEILEEMAYTGESLLPSATVRKLCSDNFPVPQENSGLFKQLQTQGFMLEVGVSRTASVRLQYERFYDIRVVQAELEKYPDVDAFRSYWNTHLLPRIGQHLNDEIPIARLFAYALLVPEKYYIELPELPMPARNEEFLYSGQAKIWEAWLDALAWRQIPKRRDVICRLFREWMNFRFRTSHFEALFAFGCIEQHPLNADYLHSWLSGLSLVKRECSWTVPMSNQDTDSDDWSLDRFVRWCDGARHRCSDEQARLAATILLWLTAVTNHSARDISTHAAIRLLNGRAEASLALVDMFWDVNDPYVKERLLAVIAGVVPTLTGQDLKSLASEVCGRFFQHGKVSLNLMEREYARFIAEFAHQRGALDDAVYKASLPPYQSMQLDVWSEKRVARYEGDPAYGTIRSSLAPEEMGPGSYGDFGRYVMGSAVHSFVNPRRVEAGAERPGQLDFEREDTLTARRYLWRRIIEMGWTPELFGEFERHLYSDGRERPPIERISKKFQWIGLYEYLGHLMDHRAYMTYSDDSPRSGVRASDLLMRDFNPSMANFVSAATERSSSKIAESADIKIPSMRSNSARIEWISGEFGSFIPYLHRVIEGASRLILNSHRHQSEPLPIGRTRSNTEHASQWVNVRSFLVREEAIDELSTMLGKMDFWGKGVRLPSAYACWLSEYPWHEMLGGVRSSCDEANPWFKFPAGLAQGTACSLDSDQSQFVLPSPALMENIEASTGALLLPKPCEESTYAIRNKYGEGVFWGSTGNNTLLAVDYLKLADWMHERNLALMWCCLSERSVSSAGVRSTLIAEATQSAVVVLRPYNTPFELTGERTDRKLGD